MDPSSKKQPGCFYQTRQHDMAHVARNFTVKPSEWVHTFGSQAPVAWPNAEDKDQGQRASTRDEARHPNGIQLDTTRLTIASGFCSLTLSSFADGSLRSARSRSLARGWVPRGSVRVYIGGLGSVFSFLFTISKMEGF